MRRDHAVFSYPHVTACLFNVTSFDSRSTPSRVHLLLASYACVYLPAFSAITTQFPGQYPNKVPVLLQDGMPDFAFFGFMVPYRLLPLNQTILFQICDHLFGLPLIPRSSIAS